MIIAHDDCDEDNIPLAQLVNSYDVHANVSECLCSPMQHNNVCNLVMQPSNPSVEMIQHQSKKSHRRAAKRKLELSLDDDSDDEEMYVPNPDDIRSSDSVDANPTQYTIHPRRKRKKTVDSKNKAWKKNKGRRTKKSQVQVKVLRNLDQQQKLRDKVISLKTKRVRSSRCVTYSDTEQSPLKKAKMMSQRDASLRTLITRIHTRRLDNLLHSNELKRVHVSADGDCFFKSVLRSLNKEDEHGILRNKICNHMLENSAHYRPFVGESTAQHSTSDNFVIDIEDIVADCLPLAVAIYNVFKTSSSIFNSCIFKQRRRGTL